MMDATNDPFKNSKMLSTTPIVTQESRKVEANFVNGLAALTLRANFVYRSPSRSQFRYFLHVTP